MLNGDTRISFDPDMPRQVTLAQGEALFDVKHDAKDPFVVVADGTRLVDIGTIFNVVRSGGALDVAVAEGAVDYEAGKQRIRLNQGDALSRPTATPHRRCARPARKESAAGNPASCNMTMRRSIRSRAIFPATPGARFGRKRGSNT